MKTISRFTLDIVDIQLIAIPARARILHFGFQLGNLSLWAEVRPEWELALRRFRLIGTDQFMPDNETRHYIGTAIGPHSSLALHCFEVIG